MNHALKVAKNDVFGEVRAADLAYTEGREPLRVLMCYLHRPVCPAMQIKSGFRQIGCIVRSAGPQSPHLWGRACGGWEYDPPDYELPDEVLPLSAVVRLVNKDNFPPELVVMVDQADDFYLVGSCPEVRFVYIASENWDHRQVERYGQRRADVNYSCVAHWDRTITDDGRIVVEPIVDQPRPLMPLDVKHLQWGYDPSSRPFLNLPRDKWVGQIGIPYEPRWRHWNTIREHFDRAAPLSLQEWVTQLTYVETSHTIFGYARSHQHMAMTMNRLLCVLSSSNVDYVPNRVPDAFATGAILLSDDVPSLRAAYGPPYPEHQMGIWLKHDRTAEDQIRQVEWLLANEGEWRQLQSRALWTLATGHTWGHRAFMILGELGLVDRAMFRLL